MDINKNLIMVKGKDRTKDILKWRYVDKRIEITFNDGKSYKYSPANVEFDKNPKELDFSGCYVIKDKQPLSGIVRLQKFKAYIRVTYKSGYLETLAASEIQFIRSCLSDTNVNSKFEYFKQIATAVSLRTEDGGNILGNRFKKINFVREDSILASYLKGILPKVGTAWVKTVIYPFGFIASQKIAVENALNSGLSVIEGPPGTGKTQTILNIIANILMMGESVAVVSNNNSATNNVLEKLKKQNLDFIAAFLGNSKNKEAFIQSQHQKYPQFKSWILEDSAYYRIRSQLSTKSAELDAMLKHKNNLSRLVRDLDVLRLEHQHFLQYYDRAIDEDFNFHKMKKLSSGGALSLWCQLERNLQAQKPISIIQRIINFFKLGIHNQSIYRYSPENIISICQRHYYVSAESELQKQISELEQKLSNYSFESKMSEYTNLSMLLFKAYVAKKYMSAQKRNVYELDDLWKHSEMFIADYPVVLSTTYSLRSSLSDRFVYDYVIVDEASQVDLATGALAFSCAKKAVIVGDLKQLSNVVTTEMKIKTDCIFNGFSIAEPYRFSNHSLLSSVLLLYNDIPRVMLKEHYRCHPKIIEFCNQKFYDDKLIILTDPKTDLAPLTVYRTVAGNHARDHVNQRQIDVITHEVLKNQGLNVDDNTIGIVSPYRNHTEALQRVFAGTSVKADTVDKFQGQEKDTIILCTVDNEVSDFTDNSNRLNVAVSRAVNQLIVVTDGNMSEKSSNVKDLISYIQYNNFEIIKSSIYSIFDCLYKNYAAQRETLLERIKKVSGFDSENLMFNLICKVLKREPFFKLNVAVHVPLKMLIRDVSLLNSEESTYAVNILTHLDFVIFDKLSKLPVIAVEVDGYAYHKKDTQQSYRDILKDEILRKYEIPIIRFKTTESSEEARLIGILEQLIGIPVS